MKFCNKNITLLYYKFKREVRMESKNVTTIVHVMAGVYAS